MRDCLDRILEYTNAERARFDASRLVQDAVIRNLQTLAESSQRLSSEIKGTEPQIPPPPPPPGFPPPPSPPPPAPPSARSGW
ncbi:MAG: DUF86 domain-containing protein [Betaproteobacteria bacterium]|nr:DUF86 domain-containing protein [Betaproteobacteria bacterium]